MDKNGRVCFQWSVYLIDLGENNDNNIQSGIRPCICVSNDINNTWSNNVQFVPLTTQHKNNLPTHYVLKKQNYSFLKEDSVVLAEQLNICSIENVVRFLGRVNKDDINKITSYLMEEYNYRKELQEDKNEKISESFYIACYDDISLILLLQKTENR